MGTVLQKGRVKVMDKCYPDWIEITDWDEGDPVWPEVNLDQGSLQAGLQAIAESKPEIDMEVTPFLDLAQFDALVNRISHDNPPDVPWHFLMSPRQHWLMCWMIEYQKQRKRCPDRRKRKSQARMGRKWRMKK